MDGKEAREKVMSIARHEAYDDTSKRLAKISLHREADHTKGWQGCEHMGLSTLLAGMHNDTAVLKPGWSFLMKVNTHLPHDPTLHF